MGKSFPIHEDFRLIATRRSNVADSSASTAFDRLGRDLWQSLSIPSLSSAELEIILTRSFPKLNQIIVNVILRLFNLIESTSTSSDVSSNSLFKFCSRIVSLISINSAESNEFLSEELRQSLLYEAVDCFASAWSSREKRNRIGQGNERHSLPS